MFLPPSTKSRAWIVADVLFRAVRKYGRRRKPWIRTDFIWQKPAGCIACPQRGLGFTIQTFLLADQWDHVQYKPRELLGRGPRSRKEKMGLLKWMVGRLLVS